MRPGAPNMRALVVEDDPGIASGLSLSLRQMRYRMARLRELLGVALEDPEVRYELEFALRSSARS